MPFHPGKTARVKVGANFLPAKQAALEDTVTEIDVTNFESEGDRREYETGFKSATFTLSGPLDPSYGIVRAGVEYPVEFTIGIGYTFVLACKCISNNMQNGIEGVAETNVRMRVTGDFNDDLS